MLSDVFLFIILETVDAYSISIYLRLQNGDILILLFLFIRWNSFVKGRVPSSTILLPSSSRKGRINA